MNTNRSLLGHLVAFFTIFVWGISFISIKVLLEAFTPVEIIFFRLILAVLALNVISPPRLAKGKPFSLRGWLQAEWKSMAAGLCGVTLYSICQNIALSYTQAANVSVLLSVAPLFTAVVSRLALNERLKTNFFIGFTVAIAGVILIAFNGSLVLRLNPLGDMLSILAALVWALYSVLIKNIGAQPGSVVGTTRKVFTYGLLFLLPALPLFEVRLGLERLAALPILLNLVFLGVGASAVCLVTWNYAVQLLGAVKTSVYIYLGPVITIIASALVLHETITPVALLGMALILAGMALSEWERKPI